MMLMWRCCKGEIALPETRWRLGWGTGNLERDEEGLGEDSGEWERPGREGQRRNIKLQEDLGGKSALLLSPPLLLIFMATMSGFFFFSSNTSKYFSETNSTNSDTVYLEVASDPTPIQWDCPPAPFQLLITSPSCHPVSGWMGRD